MQRVKACDVPVSWCPTGTCLTSRSRPPTRPCETDRPTQQHGGSTAAADYKRGQLAEAAACGSLCHSFGELSCRQVDSSVGEMSISRLHTYSHTVRYVGYSAALLSSGRRSARSVSVLLLQTWSCLRHCCSVRDRQTYGTLVRLISPFNHLLPLVNEIE